MSEEAPILSIHDLLSIIQDYEINDKPVPAFVLTRKQIAHIRAEVGTLTTTPFIHSFKGMRIFGVDIIVDEKDPMVELVKRFAPDVEGDGDSEG